MPARTISPTTLLGRSLVNRRGDRTLVAVAEQLGVSYVCVARIELAARKPSPSTALKIARWLGWTMEQVYEAANTPVGAAEAALP